MNSNTFRVGIIGAGFISNYHIRGLKEAGATVSAIASRTLTSAESKATQFEIPVFTDSYHKLLERDDVDAVVIDTPDFTHRDIGIDALEAGKPVLMQKPMARNVEECRALIDAAERTGTPLYVSFMHRYFEEVFRMRKLLAENALGEIYTVRQRNATPGADWATWFFDRDSVGGGAMMQLGVHGIDLLRHMFGEIKAVRATVALQRRERVMGDGRVVQPNNEDTILATYRMASGVLVTHETTFNEVAGTDRFRMEIYGESGSAWLRTEKGDLSVYAPEYYGQPGWFAPKLPPEVLGKRQHKHFMDMVTGDAPPDTSAHDGLVTVAVCDAVYRSAETEQWEAITL